MFSFFYSANVFCARYFSIGNDKSTGWSAENTKRRNYINGMSKEHENDTNCHFKDVYNILKEISYIQVEENEK